MGRKRKSEKELEIILKRRERVSSLMARGLSQREIQQTLANPNGGAYMLNPADHKPYSMATISRDMTALKKETESRIKSNVDVHKARQLQEIQEVKRAAWAKGNLPAVVKAIEVEMKLLGTGTENVDVTSGGKAINPQTNIVFIWDDNVTDNSGHG